MADFRYRARVGPSVALGLREEASAAGSLPGEGEGAMGGPWRDRRWDPPAWRTPVARVEAGPEAAASGGYDRVTGIVIGYVASLVTTVAIMLVVRKAGW